MTKIFVIKKQCARPLRVGRMTIYMAPSMQLCICFPSELFEMQFTTETIQFAVGTNRMNFPFFRKMIDTIAQKKKYLASTPTWSAPSSHSQDTIIFFSCWPASHVVIFGRHTWTVLWQPLLTWMWPLQHGNRKWSPRRRMNDDNNVASNQPDVVIYHESTAVTLSPRSRRSWLFKSMAVSVMFMPFINYRIPAGY